MKKNLIYTLFIPFLFACSASQKSIPEKEAKPVDLVIVNKSLTEPFEAILTKDGTLTIYNTKQTAYQLFAGKKPEEINWDQPYALTQNSAGLEIDSVSVPKMYFAAVELNGDTIYFTNRHIDAEGITNFRDAGGLPTKDGKTVKLGTFYRSGKLAGATANDKETMKLLGLKTIIDFRSNGEVEMEPDVYPENANITHMRCPIGDDFSNANSMFAGLKEMSPAEAEEMMINLYSRLPLEWSDSYKTFFATIVDTNNTPILWHCTAGKDRAGIASALLQYTLGVEKDLIYKEYELSNYYRKEENKKYAAMFAQYGLDENLAGIVMGVKAEYLEKIFAAIEAQYGSIDNYLKEALDVNETVKAKLRKMYLN